MAKAKTTAAPTLKVQEDDGGNHREQLKKLHDQINQCWVDFSLLASSVYRSEEYKDWGFASFQEYCEQELGIQYRIAMWRVQIGDALSQYNITRDMVGQSGWTKFQTVTPLLNKEMSRKDIMDLLKRAEETPIRKLREYVEHRVTHTTDGEKIEKVTRSFALTGEQDKVIEEALKDALALASTTSKSVALEYIVIEWQMNHNPDLAKKIMAHLHEPVAKVEKPRKEYANKGKKKEPTSEASESKAVETKTSKKKSKTGKAA